MIPKRVKLSGFLCYRDEQELTFDGASLWMLAGMNGSGKSAIFDAITFALFGCHRGGASKPASLVNNYAKGFEVEFDFTSDGQLYRARRTYRLRTSGGGVATQQLLKWDGSRFIPVLDTEKERSFDNWIRQNVGLTYETFTSSVLLLQGRAEKLLDAKPKDRAEVLAGIVDLERYQRLAERADSERRKLKLNVESYQGQLDAIEEVTDLDLKVAQSQIDDAREVHELAEAAIRRLDAIEHHARNWVYLQGQLADCRRRLAASRDLQRESAAIENDWSRFQELEMVVPSVLIVVTSRRDLADSENKSAVQHDELQKLTKTLNEVERAIELELRTRDELQKQIADLELQEKAMNGRLPELSVKVDRVKSWESLRQKLVRHEKELAEFPPNLPDSIAELEKEATRLAELKEILSGLTRFEKLRLELRTAINNQSRAARDLTAIVSQGQQLRAELDKLTEELRIATDARQTTEKTSASLRALCDEARRLRSDFDTLEGTKTCRTCGQPLTPGHYREELARRDKAVADAESRLRSAEGFANAAREREAILHVQFNRLNEDVQLAREQYGNANSNRKNVEAEVDRLKSACADAFGNLPEMIRLQIDPTTSGDWPTTVFPLPDDIADLIRQAQRHGEIANEITNLRRRLGSWHGIQANLSEVRRNIQELERDLPADPSDVHRDWTRVNAELLGVRRQIDAVKGQLGDSDQNLQRFEARRRELTRKRDDCQVIIRTEEGNRRNLVIAIETARKALPLKWQLQADNAGLRELNSLNQELEDLRSRDIAKRYNDLAAARAELGALENRLAELTRSADAIPDHARRDHSVVLREIEDAKKNERDKNAAVHRADADYRMLVERRKQRTAVAEKLDATNRAFGRAKLLAELVGRDRLQRHLLRRAERQIVEYANGVLDRLSGGQMMLRLVGGDEGAADEKALSLEVVNRATGGKAIGVEFLSGSQRFRVAVSLALGIGQYASRRHRPIESVIIDEGFGCLDRNGRQVMVQELQNLRGQLNCILLVSHQEEFADAFANGYHFEIANDTTKVTRVQR